MTSLQCNVKLIYLMALSNAEVAFRGWMRRERTDGSEDGTEEDGEENEGRVPVVLIVDRVDAEEHEDDRFRAAAQHLHGVLDGRMRLGRYVALHVVLHRYAAEGDPDLFNKINQSIKTSIRSNQMS